MLERDKKQREELRAFLGKRSILQRTTSSIVKKMIMAREVEHGEGGGEW